MAVSLPMPVFAPVIIIVFPSSLFVLLQTPIEISKYIFKATIKMTPTTTLLGTKSNKNIFGYD
jgi:hypothetical protein